MINKLKVLAVIPARGGSKGIPLKNLKKINGVPMVKLASQVASSVELIDRIVVSTDNEDIAEAAIEGGADAPFRRPDILSGDRISDLQVLAHALQEVERQDNKIYDIVVMLQPTSPLRTKQHIVDSIEMLVNDSYDSVWTVSKTDSKCHPFKQLTIKNKTLDYYDNKGKDIIARQQLEVVYHRNGIAYVLKRDVILNSKTIKGSNCGALICEGDFISIDTEKDLELTNYFLKKQI
jgi:CMP-N,N'-diacetyllegionaminic acid synthase